MSEIYLALIENAILDQYVENDVVKRTLSLTIPQNPEVIDYVRKQSPYFWLEKVNVLREQGSVSFASHENPLVTPSAGAISTFLNASGELRYIALSQKDAGSPRDPGFRVPRNGFPSSADDWFANNHLYREAWEEGIVMTRSGELVVSGNSQYDSVIRDRAEMVERQTNIRFIGERTVSVNFQDGHDLLRVYAQGSSEPLLEDRGVISLTPETGLNFVKLMHVAYPLEELLLIDTETFPNGSLIKRDVCAIDLEVLSGKCFGDVITEQIHRYADRGIGVHSRSDNFLTDKVPRSVLNQLMFDGRPIYPVDWMDESFEFLSNPKVLSRAEGAFSYSGFERDLRFQK